MTTRNTIPPTGQRSGHPEWHNWRWQMQNRIHSVEALQQYIDPTDDELEAIEATKGIFRWNITPYYASLMDPDDPACPIRRQVVPRMSEMQPDIVGVAISLMRGTTCRRIGQ